LIEFFFLGDYPRQCGSHHNYYLHGPRITFECGGIDIPGALGGKHPETSSTGIHPCALVSKQETYFYEQLVHSEWLV